MIEFLELGLVVAIAFFLSKSRLNYLRLPELTTLHSDASSPDLTVIVPARNEAHCIARVIQSFPGLRVIVVDDSSTDGTAEIALRHSAQVIQPSPLAADAKGKPNACAAGAAVAATKWILFVDADTWFDPPFAHAIVSYAERHNLQAVTAFLKQHCQSWAEKILLPYAFALYFTGVSARNVNSQNSKEALANGQCLLIDRETYMRIGGHRSVINSVIEDVALAARAKSMGVRLRVMRAETLGYVRMYENFAAIWRGFQKNSFRFLLINPWGGIQVVLASVVLTSWLPLLILAVRDAPPINPLRVLFSLTPTGLLFFAPALFLWPWFRNPLLALLSPVAIYGFQLIALNGMLVTLTRRKTIWKGRPV